MENIILTFVLQELKCAKEKEKWSCYNELVETLMQVSFVRHTSSPPGMVRHCSFVPMCVNHLYTMTHPPSETVTHHLKTFTHICVKIMTHHFMKMTDPWRTSFCAHRNDGPIDKLCDALTVKWLTKTHIWVSVVTNLLLPWRFYASSIWQYMTHPWRTIPGGQEVRLTNDTCIMFFTQSG